MICKHQYYVALQRRFFKEGWLRWVHLFMQLSLSFSLLHGMWAEKQRLQQPFWTMRSFWEWKSGLKIVKQTCQNGQCPWRLHGTVIVTQDSIYLDVFTEENKHLGVHSTVILNFLLFLLSISEEIRIMFLLQRMRESTLLSQKRVK